MTYHPPENKMDTKIACVMDDIRKKIASELNKDRIGRYIEYCEASRLHIFAVEHGKGPGVLEEVYRYTREKYRLAPTVLATNNRYLEPWESDEAPTKVKYTISFARVYDDTDDYDVAEDEALEVDDMEEARSSMAKYAYTCRIKAYIIALVLAVFVACHLINALLK